MRLQKNFIVIAKRSEKYGESVFILSSLKNWLYCLVVLIRYLIEGNVERKVGSGRKRKTSERTEKEILRLVKKKRRISLKEVKETLNLNVSKKTIARRLHEVCFL